MKIKLITFLFITLIIPSLLNAEDVQYSASAVLDADLNPPEQIIKTVQVAAGSKRIVIACAKKRIRANASCHVYCVNPLKKDLGAISIEISKMDDSEMVQKAYHACE